MSVRNSIATAPSPDAPATAWLIELLRAQLAGQPAPATLPEAELWPAVVSLAGYHKLVPHLSRAIAANPEISLPPEQRMALVARQSDNRRRCQMILDEMARLGPGLAAANIPWLAFKGVALSAQIGLGPDGRESSDLDLYVDAAHLEAAAALFYQAGYRHVFSEDRDRALRSLSLHHAQLGLDLDLHFAFTARRFFVAEALVLPWSTIGVHCGGQRVPTLEPEAQLLVALVNGAKERWRGLTRVFDVAALADRQPDWPRLQALCPDAYRRIMDFGLSLCHTLLDSPLPPWLAGDDPHAAYGRRLARRRFQNDGRAPRFAAELLSAAEFKWRLSVRGSDHRRVVSDLSTALLRWLRERVGAGQTT
ncbi:MAG: nucleotidyltransferase family protein [Gammaproteobacteria bacterium]|nr:nucleotidyltransferase family protein [Gammaproteobacteria bacterium]